MNSRVFLNRIATLALAASFAGGSAAPALAGGKRDRDAGKVQTVTVTVEGKKSGEAATVNPKEFAVYRGDTRQEIVDVKGPDQTPINLVIAIQEGLDIGVGHEAKTIKEFIGRLPEGSKVMVGYLRGTHFQVAEDFTTDREAAAKAVRAPVSSVGAFASAPFGNLIEALRRFDGVEGRNQIVLVSNGLDLNRGFGSASPARNIDLDRAIREAQKRGIPVWSLFANAPGGFGRERAAVAYGQGSLNRLSDETGGKAFFGGTGFVTFDYALERIEREMGNQYLIAFRGPGDGRLDVTTETPGVEIRHGN